MTSIDPQNEASGNIYKLLIGAVVPRPIAFVSSISKNGTRNLAPFSFFTVISANPPVICFSTMVRPDGTQKDTLHNVQATGEFVVNIVSEEFADKMNQCSGDYGPEIDEFSVSGLTPLPSDLVKPDRVGESHIQMECRLMQVVTISAKPDSGNLIIGEVLRFHVDESMLHNFRIDPDLLKPIGRMGGPTYTRTQDRFDLIRPIVPRT